MPKDIIDVIDTAVKIGLGALISGVTTYFVANKSHTNEKAKVLLEKKVSIIEYSIENIEPYFYALSDYFSMIDGIHKRDKAQGGSKIDTTRFKKCDTNLVAARKERSNALSRLKLIGASEVEKHVLTITDIENEFRTLLMFEKILPTDEQLKEFTNRFKEGKNKFYKSLECEFLAIHS